MPYSILPGFRVRVAKRSRYDHWQGGSALEGGAVCPVCDRPLLLLWDLNCLDPRFHIRGRPRFKDLERLPLYYCWPCCAEMDYRVVERNRVEVLRNQGTAQGKDFPYKNYPLQFDRQPIELDRLDEMPRRAQEVVNTAMGDPVPALGKRELAKWLGRPVRYGFDIWWHQLGGLPSLVQGPEQIVCPNKTCSWSRRGWAMKILAVIINDPPSGLPMVETMQEVNKNKGRFNKYVQVVFHVCRGCLTLHVGNRCD
jgi:hypothetical protein